MRRVDPSLVEADLTHLSFSPSVEERRKPWRPGMGTTAIAADDNRTELANEVMSHHHTIGLDESQSGVRVFYDVQEKPVAQTKLEQPRPVAGPEDLELGYREHWERNYANDGGRYEAWVPAYRYGTSAAADGAYKGKEWSTVEPQLKVEWERQYPESKWERFKESVKHAFSRKD